MKAIFKREVKSYFTGMIGWVGLVIPNLCRMLVGADYRQLIPASMLMGSGFLLAVDDIARLATTAEIPIGILTAFAGAPFFLYLITRKKDSTSATRAAFW